MVLLPPGRHASVCFIAIVLLAAGVLRVADCKSWRQPHCRHGRQSTCPITHNATDPYSQRTVYVYRAFYDERAGIARVYCDLRVDVEVSECVFFLRDARPAARPAMVTPMPIKEGKDELMEYHGFAVDCLTGAPA